MSLSPTKGLLVIRLWSRVGPFRAMSMFVLVLGILGGVALADRQTHQQEAAAAKASLASPSEQETANQLDAQRKAEDAASAAAARVAAAEEVARQTKPASRSTTRPGPIGPPGAPPPPIPAECSAIYTGNRAIGCALVLLAGWNLDEMACLNKLWNKESNWRVNAYNSTSGATGIPQAVPGTKMAKFGSDWRTSATTQIRWGLDYIRGRHKSPCGAWAHSQSKGWY